MAGKVGNPYHDAKGLFSTAAGDADGMTPAQLKAWKQANSDVLSSAEKRSLSKMVSVKKKSKKIGGMTPAEFKAWKRANRDVLSSADKSSLKKMTSRGGKRKTASRETGGMSPAEYKAWRQANKDMF